MFCVEHQGDCWIWLEEERLSNSEFLVTWCLHQSYTVFSWRLKHVTKCLCSRLGWVSCATLCWTRLTGCWIWVLSLTCAAWWAPLECRPKRTVRLWCSVPPTLRTFRGLLLDQPQLLPLVWTTVLQVSLACMNMEVCFYRMAADFLKTDYLFLAVGVVGGACSDVEQTFVQVTKFSKREQLLDLLKSTGKSLFLQLITASNL